MALDSLQKRRSVPGVGRIWMRTQHPVASPTGAWRSNVALSYPVIAEFEDPSAARAARRVLLVD